MLELARNILWLALLSAPWLVLGLAAAGLIRAWVPLTTAARMLGGCGLGAVTRAALIGAPLPLCSCGVLPAAFALHRRGASRATTTSFLIATPETGVDSVALSWVLLGPVLAIVRPLAAIISAICAGLLVGRSAPDKPPPDGCAKTQACGCKPSSSVDLPAEPPPGDPWWRRALDGLRYAFSDLLDDLALWLAGGLVLAGLTMTLLPAEALAAWGSGPLAMVLIMLVSVPMYVCATASTPLAHAMLYAGVSPGTVLVFLLAGPASNMASIALVRRELGTRALLAYLIGVAGVSILLGLALDAVWAPLGLGAFWDMGTRPSFEEEAGSVLAVVSLILLVVLAIRPLRRRLIKEQQGQGDCCDG